MLDKYILGYSNALEEFSDEYLYRWIFEAHIFRLKRFLELHGQFIADHSNGLENMLSSWLATPPVGIKDKFDAVWNPSFGLLMRHINPNMEDWPLVRAAWLGLHLGKLGMKGSWSVSFSRPMDMPFDQWWIDDIMTLNVASSGHEALITVEGKDFKRVIRFTFASDKWIADGDAPQCNPVVSWSGISILLLPMLMHQKIEDMEVCRATTAMVETLQKGLKIVEQVSPAYTHWVNRLLRVVIPLVLSENSFTSESHPSYPGGMMISIQDDPLRVAETMVHEISHNYLHVIETMGELINHSDKNLYYSPAKKTGRPIRSILIAYHAFMNVLIFYQLAKLKGIQHPSTYARELNELSEWRTVMEAHLQKSSGLTDIGELIWRSLSARLKLVDEIVASA